MNAIHSPSGDHAGDAIPSGIVQIVRVSPGTPTGSHTQRRLSLLLTPPGCESQMLAVRGPERGTVEVTCGERRTVEPDPAERLVLLVVSGRHDVCGVGTIG